MEAQVHFVSLRSDKIIGNSRALLETQYYCSETAETQKMRGRTHLNFQKFPMVFELFQLVGPHVLGRCRRRAVAA